MTAYVALRDMRLSRRLTAPAYHPSVPGESLLGLEPGERDTVHDLLYGLLLPSGGDAAVTLAAGDAGSVPAFVARMNATAARLGLRHTHYATPIGLDTSGNYSSAADLATLARALLRDPRFARIVDAPRATLTSGAVVRHVVNRNDLLFRYPWVIGVKTGYTLDARNVLVAAGRRHGVTLISAVLGAPTEAARDADSVELLDYGFSLYGPRPVVSRGEALARPVVRYRDARLPLVAARGARIWARADERVSTRVRAPSVVDGPIRRGRRLGSAVVRAGGRRSPTIVLRGAHSVPPPTFPGGVEASLPASASRTAVGLGGAVALVAGLALAALVAASGRGRLRDRRRRAA
jgi:serine-type D-Ala-D-Ala carboxypeptidase (penicillin-binding protein 5/6)